MVLRFLRRIRDRNSKKPRKSVKQREPVRPEEPSKTVKPEEPRQPVEPKEPRKPTNPGYWQHGEKPTPGHPVKSIRRNRLIPEFTPEDMSRISESDKNIVRTKKYGLDFLQREITRRRNAGFLPYREYTSAGEFSIRDFPKAGEGRLIIRTGSKHAVQHEEKGTRNFRMRAVTYKNQPARPEFYDLIFLGSGG